MQDSTGRDSQMKSVSPAQFLQGSSLERLQQAATFGALSAETIHWLLNEGRILQLDRGESLFEPGERGDSFFVILQGGISYYRSANDQYAYIRDHRFGQQIGFANTIALYDRLGMALATEEAVILEVDYRLFNRLRQEFPSEFGLLMMNLTREMARTIRAVDDVIVDIKSHGIIKDGSGLI
jgi:CRP-like cAMP-binding protein